MSSSAAPQRSPEAGSAAPDAEELCRRYGAGQVRIRDIRALYRWLAGLVPNAAFEECVTALERGLHWLRNGRAKGDEPPPVARLRLLLQVLDEVPQWRRTLAQSLTTVLGDIEALQLFESGLPNDRGLIEESADRLSRRFLPAPRDEHDLAELLGRLLPSTHDPEWLAKIPADLVVRFKQVVREGGSSDPWSKVRQGLLDAMMLVATRTSALGLSREIRARSPEVAVTASPFFLLPRLCDAVFSGVGAVAACREQIAACRLAVEAVLLHLEEFGVSVDVVYRIEVIGKNLDRLGDLLAILAAEDDPAERAHTATALFERLVAARLRDRSLRDLVRTNVHLLARKIIERAGETGEHYITATRAQYWKMIASAAGGGLLTVGTTWLKYLVVWMQYPLFVEGALSAANYALSFILMQLLGFTLATKQPSMTAAALAGVLRSSGGETKLDDLVTLTARICRSQIAAAIGNLGMAIPASIAFHLIVVKVTGQPFFDEKAAEHTLHSLHPTHTGTIFFAALTGVFLWLSSIGAGWVENWAVYRRIPNALAEHPAGKIFGRRFMRRYSRFFARNIAGFGGNICLGLLLGMMPVFGKFLGVPLEVRHVTLSTCSLTLAVCTLGLHAHGLLAAGIGIAIIGSLNFGVSFVLALGLATRARGVEHAGLRLLGAVLARFVRSPLEFFFPVGTQSNRPNTLSH